VNGRAVQLREIHSLSDAMLLTTDIASIAKYQNKEGFEKLLRQTRLFRTWGDCYGYLLVASGGADIMLDPIMNPWDILPLIPIIQGAKGVITTWSGTGASHGNSCVAANKILHPQVLQVLNS
jgi:fructose-1,6-bisphosphatase/inositol monophosphatase family enzyme